VIQPVDQVAELTHAAGGLLHIDAVQAAGRIPCDIKSLGADLLTLSAHKLGGPKGVGALILADQDLHIGDPLIRGGGQEGSSRAGTENVCGIAGYGAAAQAGVAGLMDEAADKARALDRLEAGVRAPPPPAGPFCAHPPRAAR